MGKDLPRNLTISWSDLLIVLGIGAVLIAGIAQFFSKPDSYVPGVVWTIVGLDALRLGRKTLREAEGDEHAVRKRNPLGPERVWTLASVRRETLRMLAQTLLVLIGLGSIAILASGSLDWPSSTNDFWRWFQLTFFPRFFAGSFLYVQFIMWLNTRMDSTVGARMKAAQVEERKTDKQTTLSDERTRVRRKKT